MNDFSKAIKNLVGLSRELKHLVNNQEQYPDTQQWFTQIRDKSQQFETAIETFNTTYKQYNKRALRKGLIILGNNILIYIF